MHKGTPAHVAPSEATVLAYEAEQIVIDTRTLPLPLRIEICRRLTFDNPEHQDAIRFNRWTGDLEPKLTYYQWRPDGQLAIPRGAETMFRDLCAVWRMRVVLEDATITASSVAFCSEIRLSASQERAVAQVLALDKGQLVAPAGSGKTVMALATIARRGQPTLWLTHTKELANQAREDAIQFLGLDPSETGIVGMGKRTIGDRLTIATLQTLARGTPEELRTRIGFVVVDECHHVPAQQMAAAVSQLPARYLLGLSATPYRSDGLGNVIALYLGPVSAWLSKEDVADRLVQPQIFRRDTGVRPIGDSFPELVTDLVEQDQRNALIIDDVVRAVQKGRRALVLSDRVEHVQHLAALLEQREVRTGALYGSMKKRQRDAVRAQLDAGQLQALVATSQLIGEGFDAPALDTLFLATPLSYHGRLTQYVGRVSRTAEGKTDAIVIDYCDPHPMLWASWAKRRDAYEAARYSIKWVQQLDKSA